MAKSRFFTYAGLILCFLVVLAGCSWKEEEFTISEFSPEYPDVQCPESIFELSQEDPSKEEVEISISGGIVSIREGQFVFWCNGATHIIKGKVVMRGYTFESDDTDPLQFKVDYVNGYVYLKGKGTVTRPDKETIKLP